MRVIPRSRIATSNSSSAGLSRVKCTGLGRTDRVSTTTTAPAGAACSSSQSIAPKPTSARTILAPRKVRSQLSMPQDSYDPAGAGLSAHGRSRLPEEELARLIIDRRLRIDLLALLVGTHHRGPLTH